MKFVGFLGVLGLVWLTLFQVLQRCYENAAISGCAAIALVGSGIYSAPWRRRQLIKRKPTIEELERILNSEEDVPIQIMPNGEIRAG